MENKTKESSYNYWDNKFKNLTKDKIVTDPWLDKFKNIIDSCNTPILDLACGFGNNTKTLIEMKKEVICLDQSDNCINNIKKYFPNVTNAICANMLDGLPFEENTFDIIIADLCLHYFTEKDTFRIIGDLRRILKTDGHLLFRVNSINDFNYGAGEGEKVEDNLYMTEDFRLKRFFDEESIKKYFKDFTFEYLKEEELKRYGSTKVTYTGCLKK